MNTSMRIWMISICCLSFHISFSRQLDSLLSELANEHHDSIQYEISLQLGYQLLTTKPDSARIFFLRSLELANVLSDMAKKARSQTLTGLTYYFNGEFDQAITNYLIALPISEELKNDRYTGIISNNIGAVYFELGDFEKTAQYYEKALNHFKVAKDTFWLSNSLNNLGNLYEKQKEFAKSIEIYEEAVALAEAGDNMEAAGSAISNIGNVYLAMEDYIKAKDQYERGLQIQRKANDKIGEAISLNNIGQILTRENNPEQAIPNHLEALKIAQDISHLETVTNSHKWLALAYEEMQLFKNAFAYQSQFILLQDSLSGIEKANAIEELNKKYETEKKDRQIAVFELEQQKTALELAKSKNLRNILIVVTVFILVIAVLFYSLFIQKKKSLRERETLLKEIHHRVKNNLQIISSLLNLQAGSLEDEVAIDAVREGQNRVKSMALIHEKLYRDDNLSGIDVDDYIKNLTETVFNSFGVDNEKINAELAIDNLKLDIDTLIPLGLILNELISNSLKYAFPDGQGEIKIDLQRNSDSLDLRIVDNGTGLDESAMEKSNSYGWKMVKSLSRKLKADISIHNESGTEISLKIKNYQLVA